MDCTRSYATRQLHYAFDTWADQHDLTPAERSCFLAYLMSQGAPGLRTSVPMLNLLFLRWLTEMDALIAP